MKQKIAISIGGVCFALVFATLISNSGCVTTKDANGTTTTRVDVPAVVGTVEELRAALNDPAVSNLVQQSLSKQKKK